VRKQKVTLLYDAVEDQEKEEARAKGKKLPLTYEMVGQVLRKRGHTVDTAPATTNIRDLVSRVDKLDSDIIFNLCESLGGVSQHEQNVASLLELLDRRFTGSGSMGLSLAQDKELAKKLLAFHGIRYPKYAVMDAGRVDWSDDLEFPVFIKPLNQDASIGIDNNAIVHNIKDLMERISYIHTEWGTPALIEEYIEGREIYVGVLGNDKPEALPIIEWDFSSVPEGTPKIASAEAKWEENSKAYKNAKEVFPEDIPESVYREIQEAAVNAFRALKLRDYGRIDLRLRKTSSRKKENAKARKENSAVGDAWEFYVIEVNPNPHLDINGEIAMAAAKHGLDYPDLMEKIIELALERTGP
jgi:D-alanine-D-alanine ligase